MDYAMEGIRAYWRAHPEGERKRERVMRKELYKLTHAELDSVYEAIYERRRMLRKYQRTDELANSIKRDDKILRKLKRQIALVRPFCPCCIRAREEARANG